MDNAPHLYGMPETEDRQGEASRAVGTGDQRQLEPGYEHPIPTNGNGVVVKETSGVAFVESTTDIGRGGSSTTVGSELASGDNGNNQARSIGVSRSFTIGGAVCIAFVALSSMGLRWRRIAGLHVREGGGQQ